MLHQGHKCRCEVVIPESANNVEYTGNWVGARKEKPGTMNSELEAMVGDQGIVGDWVQLGYWRWGLPRLG